MAWTRQDLDKIDAVLLDPTRKVTLSDGRSTEKHSLDELRRLRSDMKAELLADEGRVRPKTRFSVGRMFHR